MRELPPTLRAKLAGLLFAALTLADCAARLSPPPPAVPPQFPDLLFPEVPAELERSGLAAEHDGAWRWLQAGDLGRAASGWAAVLKKSPAFYPAETGLGSVNLVRMSYQEALERFDRTLERSRAYVPALVGRGEALLALRRDADALGSFQAALAANGSLELPKRRIEVLQFRLLQANLASARQAAESGRNDEAIAAYQVAIAASPQSAFLYRDLAAVEHKAGNVDRALEYYQKSTELEPNDASAWRDIGEILEARNEYAAAIEAYRQAVTFEPDGEIQDRVSRLQVLLALARMPAEYRHIPEAPVITRGELAALVGVRFETLLADTRATAAVVVTDTDGHWAASWIFAVTRAGVMDVYPNHTFQPRSFVRRSDLAQTVSQLLGLILPRSPTLTEKWKISSPQIADVGPGNLNYPAVALAVESGVLPLLEGDSFQLSRSVSGSEAVAAIERLEKLMQ